MTRRKARSRGRQRRLPSLRGPDLIKMLIKDGWEPGRIARHGQELRKHFTNLTRVTVIPLKNEPLPRGTLSAILGRLQTNLGRDGLLDLIVRDP